MKTLCIVPCGKKKIWDDNPNAGPTKARESLHRTFRKYMPKIRAKILWRTVGNSFSKIWFLVAG